MSKGDPSVGFGSDSYEKEAHKGLLFTWLHDFNQKAAIGRGGIAKANGLPPESYAIPFPGSVTNTKVNNFGGVLAAVVLTACCAVAGALGWKALSDPANPNQQQPSQTPATTAPPATDTTKTTAEQTKPAPIYKPEIVSVPVEIVIDWELQPTENEDGVEVQVETRPQPKTQPSKTPAPGGNLKDAPLWNGSK